MPPTRGGRGDGGGDAAAGSAPIDEGRSRDARHGRDVTRDLDASNGWVRVTGGDRESHHMAARPPRRDQRRAAATTGTRGAPGDADRQGLEMCRVKRSHQGI